MNKQVIYLLFFSTLFSQINISNELDVRYGNSSNDYNYNELILDSKITLFKTKYMIEGMFSFETLLMQLCSHFHHNPSQLGFECRGLFYSYYRDTLEVTNNNSNIIIYLSISILYQLCYAILLQFDHNLTVFVTLRQT